MVPIISKVKKWCKKSKKNLDYFLFERDGSQRIVNRKSLMIIGLVLLSFIVSIAVTRNLNKDTSHLGSGEVKKDDQRGQSANNANEARSMKNAYYAASLGDVLDDSGKNHSNTKSPVLEINYRANQVIERDNLEVLGDILPTGTKFIGKMLSSVDTRDTNVITEVLLPYGASFKGEKIIPDDSTIMGAVQYSGKNEKFFINFTHVVFPDGSEYPILAQALSSKDYSVGLIGEFHGHVGARVASTLALTAISTAADIMTKKVPVGFQGTAIAEASVENALYGAASKTAEFEARRQAKDLTSEKDYITFESGNDLIISLTKSFRRNIK